MLAGEAKEMPTKTDQKRRSYKPAAVQALVIEGRKSGHSMRRIARDSGLDRSTVKNILSQPEIEMALQRSRDTVLAALPAISEMVTADILKERDRELGFQVLKNAAIFPKEDGQKLNTLLQDNLLQIAIQTLIPASATPPRETIPLAKDGEHAR
jgi:transposase-like protein